MTGELDVASYGQVEDAVDRAIDAGRACVVIDLSGASFLDSSALGALLQCARRLRAAQGALALVTGQSTQPRARFALTGTRQILQVCESREEALALLQRSQPQPDPGRGGSQAGSLVLRLYVNSGSPSAQRAVSALDEIRRTHLPAESDVEVIDISSQPEVAERERLLAVPALVRVQPPPVRRIIGDLTDREQVLYALDLLGSR